MSYQTHDNIAKKILAGTTLCQVGLAGTLYFVNPWPGVYAIGYRSKWCDTNDYDERWIFKKLRPAIDLYMHMAQGLIRG